MAMGKRKPRQEPLFVTTDQLTPSAEHLPACPGLDLIASVRVL